MKEQKGFGEIQASGDVRGREEAKSPGRIHSPLKSSEVARERHEKKRTQDSQLCCPLQSSYLVTFSVAFQVQESCEKKLKVI